MKSAVVFTCLAILLAGCETTKEPEPVAIDTFCLTAKKRTWSIQDTAETIRDAEAWNKTIDLRCGIPRRKT